MEHFGENMKAIEVSERLNNSLMKEIENIFSV